MIGQNITIYNDALRGKKASDFVNMTSKFACSIYLEMGNKRINGKSIIGVLALNIDKNDNIRILADGADEDDAIEKIMMFLQQG